LTTTTSPITSSTTITWTYTDSFGNSSTQTQDVEIQDTDSPLANLASLPQLTAQCELKALTPPTATDTCDGTITGLTTTTLPITTSTTITWTYTDSFGNSSTQTQDVMIQDTDPPILNAAVSSEPFANTHVIVAAASGMGVYEFSLDNGPWQVSGTFIGVRPGEHIVSVRDVNCFVEDSYALMVLDYPTFFTPNGDGYNDFWNIDILSGQPTSKIYIFDRYGKLLKSIKPAGFGWNGTYNGSRMPTADYWFLLEYNDLTNGAPKQLRGHFTLKR
jgi:gliding motility-associated-like protein